MKHAPQILLAACMLALAACATPVAQTPTTCQIDPGRIVPWSQYHLSNEVQPPNVYLYEGCGRTLVYVAARHSNDPASATYAQVRAAFGKWPPGFVVVEGIPESMGMSLPGLIGYARTIAGKPTDGEANEAIRLAADAGIDFVGGEPDERDIVAGIKGDGFTATDLVAFYVVRQIEQWKREQQISSHDDPRLDTLIPLITQVMARDTGIPVADFAPVSTAAGVATWYEQFNGLRFKTGYRAEDAYPSGPDRKRRTNALSDAVSDMRDQHIVSVLNSALAQHGTVLIVYGNSHHTIAAPALVDAFGLPRFAGKLPVPN